MSQVPGRFHNRFYMTDEEKANQPKVTNELLQRIFSYFKPYSGRMLLLLLTIAVTTVAWLAATFLTRPESPEVISRFRSLVRADGRDVGKGVLMTFLVSVGIFAFMAFVAWAVSSSAVQGAVR